MGYSSILQIEKHLTSGVKQIEFPDKTRKVILTNGLQVSNSLIG